MYVVANILTLYRMERLRMVSRGLETLKNIPNSIYLSQKMNFMILFNRPVTSQRTSSSAGLRKQRLRNHSDGVIALWRDVTYVIWFMQKHNRLLQTSRPPRKWFKYTNPLQTSINNNIKLFKLWKPDSNSEATHIPYESSLSTFWLYFYWVSTAVSQ